MDNETVDRVLRVLYTNVSEESLDGFSTHDMTSLVMSVWNELQQGNVKLERDVVFSRVAQVQEYRKKLAELRAYPYIAQRTDEWYNLRKQRLTASDTAQAIGKGKFGNRDQLIQKKVAEVMPNPPAFKQMPAMKWGVMFEAMAMRCYQQRNNNVPVYEFGLIPHPTLDCYGASPDGITALGIMTEIKCPFKRKITGEVPDYYELQMQGQMAVCSLKECDYIECEMQVFENADDYFLMLDNEIKDHGVICEFIKDGETTYEYSPECLTPKEAYNWARAISTTKMKADASMDLVRMHMWKLKQIMVQRVVFDEDRWHDLVPKLKGFWSDVVEARSRHVNVAKKTLDLGTVTTTTTKKAKYSFIDDSDD
jgi:putative phage-type endonuclease